MARLLTPDYASPEQIRGDAVTVATDVYSLGVVLYELLAGRRPLEFRTRTAEELVRVISTEEPVPPSNAVTRFQPAETASRRGDTTRRLRRRLSGDLDYIVLKALEKDPARRYASVEQLAQDLRRHVNGFPVLARGGSTAYRVSRFVRRHRAGVLTGSLLAASLVAGLAGTSWQAGLARRERDRAERRFEEVRELAHAVVFDLHDAIVDLPGSTEARKTLVDHALHYLDGLSHEARDDPALLYELGVAYAKIADVQGRPFFPNLGQTAAALESYRRSRELLDRAAAARPESLAYARGRVLTDQRLADLLQASGRRGEAMDLGRSALADIERLRAAHPEDPWLPGDLVVGHDRIGDWMLAAGDTAGAVAERELCMNLAEEMFRRNPRDPGWRRSMIINCCKSADLLGARNDRAGALASYRRAERFGREAVAALGENTEARRDLSIVYGLLGLFIARGGEIDSGLAVYDLGMKISEDLAARDPANVLAAADVASGFLEIGTMLAQGNRHEEAEPRFAEAFSRYSRLAEADSANVGHRMGMALSSRGAGASCAALAARGAAGARDRWRARGLEWFTRSLGTYQDLGRLGALAGEETERPAEISRQIASLRRG
jgi:non-specific serine/threonine protein kinase/serine/threonine-protein kinase